MLRVTTARSRTQTDPAVAVAQAILGDELGTRRGRGVLLLLALDPLAVVGVQARSPQGRVGAPLGRLVAEQGLDLRRDVVPSSDRPRLGPVDAGGQAVDHAAMALVRGRQRLLSAVLGGDVDQHAAPERDRAVRLAEPGHVADPDDLAVAAAHPVLGHDPLVGAARLVLEPILLLDHAVAIVGVDVLEPDVGVGHPLLGREAQHVLDLRADVEEEAGGTGLGLVDDRRQPLDQLAVALLDSCQRPLGLDPVARRPHDADHGRSPVAGSATRRPWISTQTGFRPAGTRGR